MELDTGSSGTILLALVMVAMMYGVARFTMPPLGLHESSHWTANPSKAGERLKRAAIVTDMHPSSSPMDMSSRGLDVPPDTAEKLVIVTVLSMPGEFAQRNIHRTTWMVFRAPGLHVVFSLGKTDDVVLELEAKRFGDIVYVNSKDGDNNLNNKTVETAIWVAQHAADYKFWFKADIDTFVHPYNMIAYLDLQLWDATGAYIGNDCPPEQGCFPGARYMQGGLYGLSTDLLKAVAAFVKEPRFNHTSILPCEDCSMGLILNDMFKGRHTHYQTSNMTYAHPYGAPFGDPKWWYNTVMGVHPLKDTNVYHACFQKFRPALVKHATCYRKEAGKRLTRQIAACTSEQLPKLLPNSSI